MMKVMLLTQKMSRNAMLFKNDFYGETHLKSGYEMLLKNVYLLLLWTVLSIGESTACTPNISHCAVASMSLLLTR
jgi:hypothetical protein